MISKILSYKNKLLLLFLFTFSIAINQYYGNRGVFPIDSFLIFDSAFNIISGNHPFKDYWAITGFILDYIQSLIFLVLGINWFSYVFHASVLNMLLTLYTFYFFSKVGLNAFYAFIYSLGVSILAYPSAGTPFIDHHAVIFSVMALYSLSIGILFKKNLFWFLVPFFLIFSFFSKQIPSPYLTILFTTIIIFYFFYTKNLNKENLLYLFYGFFFSFLSISALFFINEIPVKNFLVQYIFYPFSLGNDRILGLNIDFKNLIGQFKFIYFALFPMVISLIFLIKTKEKSLLQKKELVISILFIGSIMIFIYCQLLTKNQVLIFFLIPISAAFSHAYITKYFNKKYLVYLILLIFIFSTVKYHIRFNHNKKFMELANADFTLAVKARQLDNKLKGLKWISPYYLNEPSKEIDLLIDTKKILSNSSERKIIITDYLFFSSLLKNQFASPNKWYDDLSVPNKQNKFYGEYKKFFLSKIKDNKIKYVYLLRKDQDIFFKQFIDDKECIISKELNEILLELELNKCNF